MSWRAYSARETCVYGIFCDTLLTAASGPQVQDLKVSVRVMCRVRPAGDGEHDVGGAVEAEEVAGSVRVGGAEAEFRFDRVFGPAAGQQDVFDEVAPLLQARSPLPSPHPLLACTHWRPLAGGTC